MRLGASFQAARRANVPLIAVKTSDPAGTIRQIESECKTDNPGTPLVQWNVVHGMTSMNALSAPAITTINNGQPPAIATGNPVEALVQSANLPPRSVLFYHNAHLYLDKMGDSQYKLIIQAIWNLRDLFRTNSRTLVMLVPQIVLPMELTNDVLVMDEALPNETELTRTILRVFAKFGLKPPGQKVIPRIVDAIAGLAAFSSEQVLSMSINPKTRNKISLDNLWERKIQIIEQEAGLRVHRGGPKFADIGGNDNIKKLLSMIAGGKHKPRVIVFIDEIEKAMAAAGTDSSGTTTDQLKVLLTEMQNNGWTGVIIYGFSGAGKSELAKACGNECECITVEADLGAMKSKWVGSSEANMRAFIRTIKAVGNGHVFFIATCNEAKGLRPELKRRFRKGVFFSDLPNKKERDDIWKIYFKKFGIKDTDEKPNDEGWTGAEISVCCENSSELGIPLVESAKFLTIASKAMGADAVERMRLEASGKYISTQHEGIYTYTKPITTRDAEAA